MRAQIALLAKWWFYQWLEMTLVFWSRLPMEKWRITPVQRHKRKCFLPICCFNVTLGASIFASIGWFLQLSILTNSCRFPSDTLAVRMMAFDFIKQSRRFCIVDGGKRNTEIFSHLNFRSCQCEHEIVSLCKKKRLQMIIAGTVSPCEKNHPRRNSKRIEMRCENGC